MLLLRIALRNLFRNQRRTLAVLLTVAMGTGALFIFHGFNTGLMNQYRENTVHARYGHGQINTLGYREQAHSQPWKAWIKNWPTIEPQLRQLPGVRHLFPRVSFSALLKSGENTISCRGQGGDAVEEARFFNTLNIVEGEMLSNQVDGVLLGKGLAEALLVKPGDRITVMVNSITGSINTAELQVVGIFHTGVQEFDNVISRIPLAVAQKLLGTERIESVALGLDTDSAWDRVAQMITTQFPELEPVPFSVLDKVYYQHSVDWLESQFGVIQLIIVVIVVLGIFNTVSTGILERKQEIGYLRANGESSSDIMWMLTLEGGCLGVFGAIMGCVLSMIINITLLKDGLLMPPAPGLTRQFYVLIELQMDMALKTFTMGLCTSLLATVIASWNVSRIAIAEALRSS